jgi:hypothetical protein
MVPSSSERLWNCWKTTDPVCHDIRDYTDEERYPL